jgi:hemoglobin-like flavoprotein
VTWPHDGVTVTNVTPDQLDIVATTADRIEIDPRRFADAFYNHLFDIAPHTRQLFPDDLAAQKVKVVEEFTFLANAAADLDAFVARASDLGSRHHDYGVHAADYSAVEAAMMAGIVAVLGAEATDEVLGAWRRLYRLIAETMIEGATSELYTT